MANANDRIAALARELAAQPDREQTLERIIEIVKDLVPNADEVGITLIRRGDSVTTSAASGPAPTRSDQLQDELDEGPSRDAIWAERLVVANDLEREDRWPRWAPTVADELGVRSMMCVRLFTHDDTIGAINLFSRDRHAFDPDDRDQVEAIAAHAAVAVATAGEIENLKQGMAGRTVTAQATGLMMAHYNLTATAAFEVLRRFSSEQDRKLITIAQELIENHDAQVRALR